MTLFFRWIKKTSPDLAAAKNQKLVYSNNGKPSNKACWVTEQGANRLATKKEIAASLGLSEREVDQQSW